MLADSCIAADTPQEGRTNMTKQPKKERHPASPTWDDLFGKLEAALAANGNRPGTYHAYAAAIRAVRAALPTTTGPMDINEELAHRFKEEYLTGASTRDHRARSPRGFNSCLKHLRTLWNKWVRQLTLATDNPWNAVRFAYLPRQSPDVAEANVVDEFFGFVKTRYPGWDLLVRFLQIECLLGRRVPELCALRSNQLVNGSLCLLHPSRGRADHESSRIILPERLYHSLDTLKGGEYLWERFAEHQNERLKSQRKVSLGAKPVFSPEALWRFISTLFTSFQRASGHKLNSHMVRMFAIREMVKRGTSPEVIAMIVGWRTLHPRTLMFFSRTCDVSEWPVLGDE
jgi:hypothetical protein